MLEVHILTDERSELPILWTIRPAIDSALNSDPIEYTARHVSGTSFQCPVFKDSQEISIT